MAESRDLALLTDEDLERALRGLAGSLAFPPTLAAFATAADDDDPARRARRRIEAERIRPGARSGWWPRSTRWSPRPVRRSLVLAFAILLLVAAVAGAIGLGLPGIRIVPADPGQVASGAPGPTRGAGPTASPSPSSAPSGPLGTGLGLGTSIPVGSIATAVDFPVRLPADQLAGPPDTAWVLDGRLSVVWEARAGLPPLREPGIGLLMSQFRGSLDEGYFGKILGRATVLTPVTVGGEAGWWLSGEAHELIYVGPDGEPVVDSHRFVGDALLWTDGDVTYRLESGLGMALTIGLADSLR